MQDTLLTLLFAWFTITISLAATNQTTKCSEQEWRCRDGSCIEFTARCNGTAECPDGTDETYSTCLNNRCPENMFRCAYGACINRTGVCNKQPNCNDLSDESYYKCDNTTIIELDKFKCSDGQLIPSASLCDGFSDCSDASDESIRVCVDQPCPSFMYQCAYGACIDQGANCDGVNDCADGSDESDDLCIWKPLSEIEFDLPPGHCLLPSYPDNGGYTVISELNARPRLAVESVSLDIFCNSGYGFLGNSTTTCSNGIWSSSMPNCYPLCTLEKDKSVEYTCVENVESKEVRRACKENEPHGMLVRPECRPTYHYPDGVPNHMECIKGSWSHLVTCDRDTCKLPEYDNVRNYICVQTEEDESKEVSCQDFMPEGTGIKPVCQQNYFYPYPDFYARCVDGKWNDIVQCTPECGKLNNSLEVPPWHVAVYNKLSTPYELLCAGSLVSRNVIISAAQCFWDDKLQPADNFAVAVGKIHRDWDYPNEYFVQQSDVNNIIVPSEFSGALNDFKANIALVFLSTEFRYNSYVSPVCLDFDVDYNAYQLHKFLGKVASWGLKRNGEPSESLNVADLIYIKQRTCAAEAPAEAKRYITNDKICSGFGFFRMCRLDAGAGYAFPGFNSGSKTYYLRGVVSLTPYSDDCKKNIKHIFTHVIDFKQVIQKNIEI